MPPGDRGAGKYYHCPLNLTWWCRLQAWLWYPPQPHSPTFLKQMEGSCQFRHYPDALLEPNKTGSCSTSLLPGRGGRTGTVAALYCSLAKVCARGQLWHSMTLPHEKTTYLMGEDICKSHIWYEVNILYIRNLYNSITKNKQSNFFQRIFFLRIWIGIFPKKASWWPKGTGKDAQYH